MTSSGPTRSPPHQPPIAPRYIFTQGFNPGLGGVQLFIKLQGKTAVTIGSTVYPGRKFLSLCSPRDERVSQWVQSCSPRWLKFTSKTRIAGNVPFCANTLPAQSDVGAREKDKAGMEYILSNANTVSTVGVDLGWKSENVR